MEIVTITVVNIGLVVLLGLGLYFIFIGLRDGME
jgi:hypothetical protein